MTDFYRLHRKDAPGPNRRETQGYLARGRNLVPPRDPDLQPRGVPLVLGRNEKKRERIKRRKLARRLMRKARARTSMEGA